MMKVCWCQAIPVHLFCARNHILRWAIKGPDYSKLPNNTRNGSIGEEDSKFGAHSKDFCRYWAGVGSGVCSRRAAEDRSQRNEHTVEEPDMQKDMDGDEESVSVHVERGIQSVNGGMTSTKSTVEGGRNRA